MDKPESKGTTLIISGVLLAIVVAFLLIFLPSILQPEINLRLGDGVFRAKVALNDADRTKGLSGVKQLDSDQALLMAFPSEGMWSVWMKGMIIPIDIVWLNKDMKVISIVKNISPEESTTTSHYPKTPAKYIIEFPAGTVDSKMIKTNSAAIFKINSNDIK